MIQIGDSKEENRKKESNMQNEIVEETVAIDNPLAKETTDLNKTNIDIHNIVREISKGDIWNVSQGNGLPTGTEIWSNRPAVIVSNEAINKKAGFVNIVYLTTAEKKPFPNHIPVISGGKQATALCEQIVTVDKSRLTGYISSITEEELTDIERAILFTLGISNSIKPNPIYEKWVNAIERYEMDMRRNPGEDIDDITALKNSVNIWKDMYQKEHAISGRLMKLINEGAMT